MPESGKPDPYRVLGVPRGASDDEIKKAYRELAKQTHPDRNAGDAGAEARFKEVSEAYASLSDPGRRQAYDEFGEIALDPSFDANAARRARAAFGGSFRSPPPGGGFEGFSFGLDDLMSDFFPRGGAAQRPFGARRGGDLEADLELEFLEAARGGERRVVVTRPTADGGTRSEAVTVKIPAGVSDGGRIRLAGRGAEGRGGAPAGDLYATIRIRPHAFFKRQGRDVHLTLPVTVREACLGAQIEIPTLQGRATVTLPAGTDGGRRLRLRGKGIPNPTGGAPGDLYVTVEIRVPRDLDAEARGGLDALSRCDPEDPRRHLSGDD